MQRFFNRYFLAFPSLVMLKLTSELSDTFIAIAVITAAADSVTYHGHGWLTFRTAYSVSGTELSALHIISFKFIIG